MLVSDYRGVIFGYNDTTEYRLDGKVFGLAYYYYKDSRYAEMIKKAEERDVIFGERELPETNYEFYKKSFYTSHSGVIVLRTQKEDRDIEE